MSSDKSAYVILEGGPLHGCRVATDSPDKNTAKVARHYYSATEDGRLGGWFYYEERNRSATLIPSKAIKTKGKRGIDIDLFRREARVTLSHGYEVISRREYDDYIAVVLIYREVQDPS